MVIVVAYSGLYKVPVEATLVDMETPTFAPPPLSPFRPTASILPFPFPLPLSAPFPLPYPLPFFSALHPPPPFLPSRSPLSSFRPSPSTFPLPAFFLPFPSAFRLTPPYRRYEPQKVQHRFITRSDKQTSTRTFIAEGPAWQFHDRVACRRRTAQSRDLHGALWDHFPDLYI